jgi:ADP-heptose:LPS heptosyltransferase
MSDAPGPAARAEPLARLASPPPAERILVIRLGAVGDVVRTRFAFAGLRELYPDAEIDWLVEDRAAGGLDGIEGLRDIVRVPRRRVGWARPLASLNALLALGGELRERRYDLVCDFHSILKSALLALRSSTPVRVGYGAGIAREGSARFFTHTVRFEPEHVSRFERNAALLRFLGGEVPDAPPPLALPAEVERELADVPSGLFAMHPGTSDTTRYKRWPPERYAEVARNLLRAEGRESLVTWGPVAGERECAERVVEASRGAARLAPPTPSILHALSLLRRSCLYVGSDSGPMHLASLAGLPVVGGLGPPAAGGDAPFPGLPSRVIRHDVGCNPCREGCPVLTCMAAIAVDEVVKGARELIARPSGLD